MKLARNSVSAALVANAVPASRIVYVVERRRERYRRGKRVARRGDRNSRARDLRQRRASGVSAGDELRNVSHDGDIVADCGGGQRARCEDQNSLGRVRVCVGFSIGSLDEEAIAFDSRDYAARGDRLPAERRLKRGRLNRIVRRATNVSEVIRYVDAGPAGRVYVDRDLRRARRARSCQGDHGVSDVKLRRAARGESVWISLVGIHVRDGRPIVQNSLRVGPGAAGPVVSAVADDAGHPGPLVVSRDQSGVGPVPAEGKGLGVRIRVDQQNDLSEQAAH